MFFLLACATTLTASSAALGAGAPEAPEPPPPRPADGVVVLPYERPMPPVDVGTAVFVQMSDGPVRCSLEAKISGHGDIDWVSTTACPRSIEPAAEGALRGWSFHPPVLEDKAVNAIYEVEFEYVAASVEVPVTERPDWVLVRVPPIAKPRWPVDPAASRAAQRYLEQSGRSEVRCSMHFAIGARDLPEQLEVDDCPGPLAEQVKRMGRRWGFDVQGGEPGDGTVYTYAATFSRED